MVEARAMKEGLVLANRLGYNVVEAESESDSTETIETCTGMQCGGANQRQFLQIVLILQFQLEKFFSLIVRGKQMVWLMS